MIGYGLIIVGYCVGIIWCYWNYFIEFYLMILGKFISNYLIEVGYMVVYLVWFYLWVVKNIFIFIYIEGVLENYVLNINKVILLCGRKKRLRVFFKNVFEE